MTKNLSLTEYEDVCIPVPWGHIAGRWYGNREVRPILAIHGWLDNLGTFFTLIPQLPAHIGLLCIDLPGHGLSSHYPPGIRYSTNSFVSVIHHVLNEYNWQRVSLMGHSLGAALCFMYAAICPHAVDLLIAIDGLTAIFHPAKIQINHLAEGVEKLLVEDERAVHAKHKEPPSYTYARLEQLLKDGSFHSVELENAKYLLERSISKSQLYPEKYYFSRDGRVKYYLHFVVDKQLAAEMARRIRNIPFLLIKPTDSLYIKEYHAEALAILRAQNEHFEIHEITGTHHVHLNNPKACAGIIVPFLNRHRPAVLSSWSVDEQSTEAPERFFAWNLEKLQQKKLKSKL